MKRANEVFLVHSSWNQSMISKELTVTIMSLHDFTGWIPEILILPSGEKDQALLLDVEIRWQSTNSYDKCEKWPEGLIPGA